MPAEYEVIALRYGVLRGRRSDHFYRHSVYGEPDRDLQMDYFFWVVRDDQATVLVDSGYHPDALASRPGRECLIPPVEALKRIGIAPEAVSDVIVTHFHFDHIGNLAAFPNATYTLQRAELEFWAGPHGRKPAVAASVEAREVAFLVDAVSRGRVRCIEGDQTVRPGISARLLPGHCPGQQVVAVNGLGDGPPVVLASDALHFYEEMERDMPFEVFTDIAGMYDAYQVLRDLEQQGAVIVAGHDPAVVSRFAPLPGSAPGTAVHIG